MQGLTIIPGVIDSDYTGEIQIMASPPTKTLQIHQGPRIAQLLLLPYHTAIGHTVTQNEMQDKGFGSSDIVFWVTEITQKLHMETILVRGKSIVGLLDTEADVSCISGKDWSSSWPTHTTENVLVGLGRAPAVANNAKILNCQFGDTCGTFQPYAVPSLSFTLWGRDVLSQMGVLLFSPDDKVTSQMLQMGYDPSKGLGKQQSGIIEPLAQLLQATNWIGLSKFIMEAIVFAANPITWKSQDPLWVEQWPLPKEKLLAAKMLISEQLVLGHIEPSNSPWNTPIFVIKKKIW